MKSSQGVTLPELLIALMLVAILLALALPATQTWRARTLSTRCVSNLQQVGKGLFAYAVDHQQTIPTAYNDLAPGDHPNQTWATQLLLKGYVERADLLLCPAFFPRKAAEATRSIEANGAVQAYGMRRWVEPGKLWLNAEISDGHRRLHNIVAPSEFFLIVDSYWTPATWKSQGYSVTPGSEDHRVHLRHQQRANALFADGHVAAHDGDYFTSLSKPDAEGGQRRYTGGREKEIYTIIEAEPLVRN